MIEFGWVTNFKDTIFENEILWVLVPILMALKKISVTPIEDTSLWLVLARRLVNMKLQRGLLDPKELP